MLFINNDHVARVLTMGDTIAALEKAYADLAAREAVCRPRVDIQIPTSDPHRAYRWGTMEGGAVGGYFAIRMKSDVIYETEDRGVRTQEKYCTKPGLYCGLIFLGADGGIGVKYMSREDSAVVGMLGSGGMARTHLDAFLCVRNIRKVQVFSPTEANREAFAAEVRDSHGIEVAVCDNARDVYRGADIVAGCTNSALPVIVGEWLEPGQHVLNVGAGGMASPEVQDRIDVYFRFGDAPAPQGLPEMVLADQYLAYVARPDHDYGFTEKKKGSRAHGRVMADRMVTFADIQAGTSRGRTSRDQITYSERGNLQGNQFHAVAGRVYERAREQGLGNEVPTDWFLQDIRD